MIEPESALTVTTPAADTDNATNPSAISELESAAAPLTTSIDRDTDEVIEPSRPSNRPQSIR